MIIFHSTCRQNTAAKERNIYIVASNEIIACNSLALTALIMNLYMMNKVMSDVILQKRVTPISFRAVSSRNIFSVSGLGCALIKPPSDW